MTSETFRQQVVRVKWSYAGTLSFQYIKSVPFFTWSEESLLELGLLSLFGTLGNCGTVIVFPFGGVKSRWEKWVSQSSWHTGSDWSWWFVRLAWRLEMSKAVFTTATPRIFIRMKSREKWLFFSFSFCDTWKWFETCTHWVTSLFGPCQTILEKDNSNIICKLIITECRFFFYLIW